MLKGIPRSTLASEVARQLERVIVSGEWPEGTRIPPEPRLVEILGVGRNTVREAVRALTRLGLLEARPGDGTYVLPNSLLASSLAHRLAGCSRWEIVEARECLERQAARLAAERRTDDDLRSLREGLVELLEEPPLRRQRPSRSRPGSGSSVSLARAGTRSSWSSSRASPSRSRGAS